MSKTYRLKEYKKGKPVYTRHENKDVLYHWSRHEDPKCRRSFNRSKRKRQRQYLKKFGYVPKIPPTNGWETH